MTDPRRTRNPEDVLASEHLTQLEKRTILRQWEFDERELSNALNEGMPGEDADMLGRIVSALGRLAHEIERGKSARDGA